MVVIRLARGGAKKRPFYQIIVTDSRNARDGRFIEIIGQYQPLENPSMINIKDDRALYWLAQGAQPSETVQKILTASGVWEQYEKTRPKKSLQKAAARTKAVKAGQKISQDAHAAKKAPKVEDAPAAEEAVAETESTESE